MKVSKVFLSLFLLGITTVNLPAQVETRVYRLTKLFCLLLVFCSGFTSCGNDKEKELDPCLPFEVALEKADAVYTDAYTLYGMVSFVLIALFFPEKSNLCWKEWNIIRLC